MCVRPYESRPYVSVRSLRFRSLACRLRGGLCRFGEAWAALVAEYLLTYLLLHTTLTLGMLSCGEELSSLIKSIQQLLRRLCRVLIVVHVSAVPSAECHL